ncbi:MAG: alpha/beta fold hydrolase [Clostridia bacterium]|nr:alpha/beta fold hydrolase [Clostridia bacterium]
MEWYYYLIIVAATVAVFAVVFTLGPAVLVYKTAFGHRQDKNPRFKYFTPEDFDLTVEHMPVRLYGIELAANLYTAKPVEDCERVVIFQHGFGAGSASYMTEIAHFAKRGFAVVAVDAYGCNNSAGKTVKGFYAGAEAVIAAYIGVNRDERLKNKPVILVGHSWGAYSVLAACGTIKVDGVVAMSGFNAPAQCVCDIVKSSGGGLGKLFAPLVHGWIWLFNFFKFGAKGNLKAAKAVKKSGVKTLIIHGEKDDVVVGYKNSAVNKVKGENVTTLMLADKRHNPYNTVAAEDKLAELTGAHKFEDEKEAQEYFANFDWVAVTEEDEDVMRAIDEFIENV